MSKAEEAPRISVVIVNHNGQRFLERACASLRSQTHVNREVLCVDTASSDDSVSFLKTHFPEVRVIEAENRGFGTACNLGARSATGTYVMFLNEDMHVPPRFLESLLQAYTNLRRENPNIGALGCTEDAYDGTRRPDVYPGTIDCFGFVAPNRQRSRFGAFIPGCPFFIRRDLFLESGGFCEQIFLYGDDTDLSWRLVLRGKTNATAPEIRLYHYEGGSMEGFPPRKIRALLLSTMISLFNNYSFPALCVLLPLNLLSTLTVVNAGLFLLTHGGLRYNAAAFGAIADFVRTVPALVPFRRRVQQMRVVSDLTFLRRHITLIPSLLATRSYRRL